MGGLVATILLLLVALGGLALYLKQERVERLEQLLDTRRRELEEQRQRFEEAMQDLERRERVLAAREEELAAAEALLAEHVNGTSTGAAGIRPNHPDGSVSLLFLAGPGYRLLEIEPQTLAVGSALDLDGQTYVVACLKSSPLPADHRRCAYVEPSTEARPGELVPVGAWTTAP